MLITAILASQAGHHGTVGRVASHVHRHLVYASIPCSRGLLAQAQAQAQLYLPPIPKIEPAAGNPGHPRMQQRSAHPSLTKTLGSEAAICQDRYPTTLDFTACCTVSPPIARPTGACILAGVSRFRCVFLQHSASLLIASGSRIWNIRGL